MAFVRRSNRLVPALLLAVGCSGAAAALPQSTLAAYTAHLQSLRSLVESCRANASACSPDKVGSDEQVNLTGLDAGANVNSFDAHYDWLRETLRQAHDPAMKERSGALDSAATRLQEAIDNAQTSRSVPAKDFARARTSANAILRHPEFVTVTEQSIWERIGARIILWLDKFFNGVGQFGQRAPWIGPFFEWGLIVLALSGLAVWAMRVLQRQRLRIAMEAQRQIEPWEEDSLNWRAQAAEQAARQDWREAVHCLYWASIVMLEGRRFWTPNRSRTPREYVRLLEAGSPRWTLLRRQTQGFERIWYGLLPAQPDDYETALQMHEQLRTT
jgi:Domain of unknown function (DUF4129)